MGCSPWGCKELDVTERLSTQNNVRQRYNAWKIPWTEERGRLQSMGLLESDTTERLHFHFSPSCTGEGNGNPLQCSCLENPRDSGAWWAAVYGVAQSRTRLKRLSSSSGNGTRALGHYAILCATCCLSICKQPSLPP